MAHQLAALVVTHRESGLRQMIFPELSSVMKQHAGNEQIEIELWVERRDRHRHPHHLGDVLDEAAAASMMIGTRARRSPEAFPVLAEKRFAERTQTRIAERTRPFA